MQCRTCCSCCRCRCGSHLDLTACILGYLSVVWWQYRGARDADDVGPDLGLSSRYERPRACVVANRDASTPTCCAGSLA